MKASVAIITYNHERYVARALDGVLAQRTDFPVEAVVRDDRSPDRTGEIVRGYAERHPDRVRSLPADENLGPIPNLARVIAACTGEYVALLEGDDYWTDPDKLRRQVEFLDAHPDHSFCFHPVTEVGPDDRPGRVFPPPGRTEFTFADLFPRNFIPTAAVVFRRALVPTLPDWMLDHLPGDWPLHMLNAARGPFRMLPEVMGAYRQHPGGVWSPTSRAPRYRRTVAMLEAARPHFDPAAGELFDRAIAMHRFELAWVLAGEGDRASAAAILNELAAGPDLRRYYPLWKRVAGRVNLYLPRVVGWLLAARQTFDFRHQVRPPDAARPAREGGRP